jgi:hypothetical protein
LQAKSMSAVTALSGLSASRWSGPLIMLWCQESLAVLDVNLVAARWHLGELSGEEMPGILTLHFLHFPSVRPFFIFDTRFR